MLAGCEACQRIDPALRGENMVSTGNLAVDDNWSQVAIDVTHFNGQLYLLMVDCGPSRISIWRRLQTESAMHIVSQLRSVIIERGPCDELLLDNSAAFRSAMVAQFADEWGITLRFLAAYALGGNGIVERNHQTIKRIAERGGISPEEATFWYNVTPRKEIEESSVPSNLLFRYRWRVPFDVNLRTEGGDVESSFSVGDEVWVKPSSPSCVKQWMPGKVTRIVSKHTVCVDGMPRHVRDIRKQQSGVSGGSHGNLQVDDLQGRSAETEPGGDPFISPLNVDVGEIGFVEQMSGQETPEVPEVVVLEDSSQGLTQEETGEVQSEFAVERDIVEQVPLRRSQRVRRFPRYLDQYEC